MSFLVASSPSFLYWSSLSCFPYIGINLSTFIFNNFLLNFSEFLSSPSTVIGRLLLLPSRQRRLLLIAVDSCLPHSCLAEFLVSFVRSLSLQLYLCLLALVGGDFGGYTYLFIYWSV